VQVELIVGEEILHSVQLVDLFFAPFQQLKEKKKNKGILV
jgi:hypothetical protein